MNQTTLVLLALGVINPEVAGQRMDDGQTVHLTKALQYVKAQTYDVNYAARKFRTFVPIDSSAPAGAESIVYRQYDMFGMAKVIHAYADDIPLVGVSLKEFSSKVESVAVGYDWSIQDLRRAQLAGTNLEDRKAKAARAAVEAFLDDAAATGIPGSGMKGVVNNTNVPVVVLPNPGVWSGLSSAQIIENLNYLVQTIVVNTKQTMPPNTLVLDTTNFMLIAQKPIAIDNQKSILQSFLENNPFIKNIDMWNRLDGAGATGKNRLLMYTRDPSVLTFNVPVEFEQFPPQAKNLTYFVPCHSRVGGVEFHYPLAAAYADIPLT